LKISIMSQLLFLFQVKINYCWWFSKFISGFKFWIQI
jgi:hypothetical protein